MHPSLAYLTSDYMSNRIKLINPMNSTFFLFAPPYTRTLLYNRCDIWPPPLFSSSLFFCSLVNKLVYGTGIDPLCVIHLKASTRNFHEGQDTPPVSSPRAYNSTPNVQWSNEKRHLQHLFRIFYAHRSRNSNNLLLFIFIYSF